MTGTTNGTLFVISAPSGAGKTTLCRMLLEHFPDIRYSVSFTTRAPRAGETDGVDYHFIRTDEFSEKLERGEWAEWALVHGNYYGTSAEFVRQSLTRGHDILMDIDVQGAMQIFEHFPDAVSIFIAPPSMEVLEQRLGRRGTDSQATIQKRLQNAVGEMEKKDRYRHVLVNDDLEKAVDALIRIVRNYRKG